MALAQVPQSFLPLSDNDLVIIRQVLTSTIPPPSVQHDVPNIVDRIDGYFGEHRSSS